MATENHTSTPTQELITLAAESDRSYTVFDDGPDARLFAIDVLLRDVVGLTEVCSKALFSQDCEIDSDVARILQGHTQQLLCEAREAVTSLLIWFEKTNRPGQTNGGES